MLLRKHYYLLKPTLPWAFRMAVRRFFARRLRKRYGGSWPINQLAGRAPSGWAGWPNGKKFAFVLTHDVERQKGLHRCRELAEMEMRLGYRSSFNFVPQGEYAAAKSLREFLVASGFEVGIHDLQHDGKLYNSRKQFEASAQKINEYLAEWGAVGFRSGFMLHNLDWLRGLNILYDSSTFDTDPFEPQPDGVNTIFPFWVPREDGSGYIELPYTLPQDSTVFLLLGEPTIDIWMRKVDWVAQQGGLALMDIHPDYMNFHGTNNSSEYAAHLYADFLAYVARKYRDEAWFALPRDVAAHIRRQELGYPQQRENYITAASKNLAEVRGIPRPAARPNPGAFPGQPSAGMGTRRLQGKRAAMVLFSFYPDDPRPRRAAEVLVSRGMRVELICLRESSQDPKREVVNGVDVRRIPIARRRGGVLGYFFQYSAFIFYSSAILAKRLLTCRYDLVYVHNMPDVLVLSGLLPKLFGAKVVLDLHDPMPELMMTIFGTTQEARSVRFLKLLEKWSLRLADAVVTVNRTCAKLFASRSCPEQKIHVVMNSPDEEIFRFQPPATPAITAVSNRPFVIMYHGSLVGRNGLDLAVDAFAHVRQSIPNAELTIYGSRNAFLERVMNSVRNRGLEKAVHYLGPKPLELIVEAIKGCDVGIIPNQRNIFTELNTPTRIFEYLAIGKPVIAPRAPGVCDYFDDQSLMFFELGNAEDLARMIKFAYDRPEEVAKIVARGQEVHRAHTWREERLRLTELVADLLCGEEVRAVPSIQKLQAGPASHYEEGAQ